MVEVCYTRKDFIRIAGDGVASGVVKSRFLKLNHEHIAYVLDRLNSNTILVRNIKGTRWLRCTTHLFTIG